MVALEGVANAAAVVALDEFGGAGNLMDAVGVLASAADVRALARVVAAAGGLNVVARAVTEGMFAGLPVAADGLNVVMSVAAVGALADLAAGAAADGLGVLGVATFAAAAGLSNTNLKPSTAGADTFDPSLDLLKFDVAVPVVAASLTACVGSLAVEVSVMSAT